MYTNMKKTLSLALILALSLTYTVGAAETAGTVAGASTVSVAEAAPTPAPVVDTPLTLTAKKLKAETDLRAIYAQFNLFTLRTQATIDRLSTKGIDTTTAQTALTTSTGELAKAKTALDLFTTIAITDDMTEDQVLATGLKMTLAQIQASLTIARTHLIESLTALRSAVSISTLPQ